MNNYISTLIIFLICISPEAQAFRKENTTYTIERSWFDNTHLYVLYKTTNTIVHFSFTDIEGTVLKETNTFSYQKIDKNLIPNVFQIDLRYGIPANGLIYADEDYKIADDNSSLEVITAKSQVRLACNREVWGDSNPVRFKDKLFYCGNVISSDGSIKQIPHAFEESIRRFALERNPIFRISTVASCSSNGNELDVFVIDDGRRKGADLDFLRFNLNTLQEEGIGILPFGSEEYRVANHYLGHLNDGALVEKRIHSLGKSVFICIAGNCSNWDLPASFSYLVVDRPGKSLLIFEQERLTSPQVTLIRQIFH